MTQKQDNYKQTEFGKFSNEELITFLENDPDGKDWLDAVSRHVEAMMDMKQFGIESAKELIAAAILRGGYVPLFARHNTPLSDNMKG